MRPSIRFRCARFLLRAALSSLFRVRVTGLEGLPKGASILACNHLNWVDPFLVLAYLPARPRIHYLGRRSAVFNRRWKRFVLWFFGGVIPVEAGHSELAGVVAKCRDLFAREGALGVFPEGAVGPEEGALQPLRPGVAHFAAALPGGVPAVPVGLAGTSELWLRRPIRVRVGPVLRLSGASVETDLRALSQAMLENLPPCPEASGPRRWGWLTTLLR